jgi:hypothetical protein
MLSERLCCHEIWKSIFTFLFLHIKLWWGLASDPYFSFFYQGSCVGAVFWFFKSEGSCVGVPNWYYKILGVLRRHEGVLRRHGRVIRRCCLNFLKIVLGSYDGVFHNILFGSLVSTLRELMSPYKLNKIFIGGLVTGWGGLMSTYTEILCRGGPVTTSRRNVKLFTLNALRST